MLKETGYQEKFILLKPWLEEIVETVKKDLKNDHLKKDRNFCNRYFLGKNPNQITGSEMAPAYEKEVAAGNVGLGEFIATRWLLKHTDIYYHFETKMKKYTPDFETLDELPLEDSKKICAESVSEFGPVKTYIFSVFNSVVFPKAVYDDLQKNALKHSQEEKAQKKEEEEKLTLENLQNRYARELRSAQERFEKKLEGLQKKYLQDVENLRKQVRDLQKKLAERT